MMKFIAIVWTAFLARVNPVSTIAKPSCMNITRNEHRSSHARLRECSAMGSAHFGSCFALDRRRWRSMAAGAAGGHRQVRQAPDDEDEHHRHEQPAREM